MRTKRGGQAPFSPGTVCCRATTAKRRLGASVDRVRVLEHGVPLTQTFVDRRRDQRRQRPVAPPGCPPDQSQIREKTCAGNPPLPPSADPAPAPVRLRVAGDIFVESAPRGVRPGVPSGPVVGGTALSEEQRGGRRTVA